MVNIMDKHHFLNLTISNFHPSKSVEGFLKVRNCYEVCIIDVKLLEQAPKLLIV